MYSVNDRECRAGIASLVLRAHVLCACLSVVLAGASSAAEPEKSRETRRLIAFDISAQPLARALDAYSVAAGMAGLVEQQLVMGKRSAAVKGRLTPDQALRILLAGTNLSIRYASRSAFILTPIDKAVEPEPANSDGAVSTGIRQAYFSSLQETLTQLFCRRLESQPGSYRLGLQLWIGSNGMVQASHLLNSTGDRGRDAAIADLLGSAMLATPPAELPQPVTVLLLPHSAEGVPDCAGPERHPK